MKRIYIARDAGDALYLYSKPPEKKDEYWSIAEKHVSDYGYAEILETSGNFGNNMKKLFEDVKWEDPEAKVILLCW